MKTLQSFFTPSLRPSQAWPAWPCFVLIAVFSICFTGITAGAAAETWLTHGEPDGPMVYLDSGDILHVIDPNTDPEKLDVAIWIDNPTDERLRGRVRLQVETFEGRAMVWAHAMDVAAGKRQRVSLPPELILGTGERVERGIRWMTATLRQDGGSRGGKPIEVPMAVAVMEPTGPAPSADGPGQMRFAIAYGAGPENEDPMWAKASARAGFNAYRGGVTWSRAQPKPGQPPVFSEEAMRRIEVHEAAGLEPLMLVSGSTRWASPERGYKGMPDLDAWRVWVRALAEEMSGRAVHWEIWNEPDIGFFEGTIEEYQSLLRAASEEIRAVDPTMRVMTGGFVSMDGHGGRKVGMVERVIDENQDDYDVVAYHKHGGFSGFREELDEKLGPYMDGVLRSPRPLYFTETGMDTRFGQHHQARTLVQKMAFAWSRGAVGYTWYSLFDTRRATSPTQPGFTYGLYTRTRSAPELEVMRPEGSSPVRLRAVYPKASYLAMNTFSSVLGGAAYERQIDLPEGQFAFVFRRGDEQVIVVWNDREKEAAATRLVETDAEEAWLVDLMGNRTDTAVIGGRVRLDVGVTPRFLVLRGGEQPVSVEGEFAVVRRLEIDGGDRPMRVSVVFNNPEQQDAKLNYQWQPAAGFGREAGAAASGSVVLPAGGELIVDGAFVVDGSQAFSLGDRFVHVLKYEMPDAGVSGQLEVPVVIGAVVISEGEPEQRPVLVMDTDRDMYNRFEHDPNSLDLMWQGWRDLSVRVHAAHRDGRLEMRIQCRDDVAHAPTREGLEGGDVVTLVLTDASGGVPRTIRLARIDDQLVSRTASNAGEVDTEALRLRAEFPADHTSVYHVSIDVAALGLDWSGLRFNLAYTDHDGRPEGIETVAATVAPDAKGEFTSPDQWPVIVRQQARPTSSSTTPTPARTSRPGRSASFTSKQQVEGMTPIAPTSPKWSELRSVPAMRMYHNTMHLFHISYAAFPNAIVQHTDYIRARRYLPGQDSLRGTAVPPAYNDTGLFTPGVPHRITVVKRDQAVAMRVANDIETRYFHWANTDLPPITAGRIGLRQMYTRSALIRDFRVRLPAPTSPPPRGRGDHRPD
ncbi:MAG: hypothetical protein AAF797_02115 [Planctomycetota bacterium]